MKKSEHQEVMKMADPNNPTPKQHNELLFMQLVMMFQGMALQNLGKVINPVTNQIERNLDQAKNFIDILGMLDEKTKGNLKASLLLTQSMSKLIERNNTQFQE